jgi:hypothetical protein
MWPARADSYASRQEAINHIENGRAANHLRRINDFSIVLSSVSVLQLKLRRTNVDFASAVVTEHKND